MRTVPAHFLGNTTLTGIWVPKYGISTVASQVLPQSIQIGSLIDAHSKWYWPVYGDWYNSASLWHTRAESNIANPPKWDILRSSDGYGKDIFTQTTVNIADRGPIEVPKAGGSGTAIMVTVREAHKWICLILRLWCALGWLLAMVKGPWATQIGPRDVGEWIYHR